MIHRRSPREIECMRAASAIAAEALKLCCCSARAGVTTATLDSEAESLIRARQAVPLFKGYRGYPSSICASINEEVVHGMPGTRKLRSGDLLSVDVGVRLGNYCGDVAATVAIGDVSEEASRLMEVCKTALERAIEALQPNVRLSTVSRAIQGYVEAQGCSVVRKFTGHGIGREMHEEPQVPNFVSRSTGDPILPTGVVLAIEPMVNAGDSGVEVLDNGWTVVTRDRSLSAHFEHTVAITKNGPDILTLEPA